MVIDLARLPCPSIHLTLGQALRQLYPDIASQYPPVGAVVPIARFELRWWQAQTVILNPVVVPDLT